MWRLLVIRFPLKWINLLGGLMTQHLEVQERFHLGQFVQPLPICTLKAFILLKMEMGASGEHLQKKHSHKILVIRYC